MIWTLGVVVSVVLAIAVIGFLLVRSVKADEARIAELIEKHGLDVVEDPRWRATGSYRGLDLLIEQVDGRIGKTTVHRHRVTVTGGQAPRALVQRQAGGAAPTTQPTDLKRFMTGDGAFDGRYAVYVADEVGERLWRDESLRSRIVEFGTRSMSCDLVELVSQPGQVAVTIGAPILKPEQLQWGMDLAADLATGPRTPIGLEPLLRRRPAGTSRLTSSLPRSTCAPSGLRPRYARGLRRPQGQLGRHSPTAARRAPW